MTPLIRPFNALLVIVLVASGLGCGSSGRGRHTESVPVVPFDQPEVALREVRLRGVGILGGALDVEMQVYNPNGYDLEKPRVSYRVLVEDVEIATGLTDLDIVVPSHDSAVVRVPASFSYAAMKRAGRALVNTGAAPYRVLGRITVGTPYGRLSFPYDRAGHFSTLRGQPTR